MRVVLLQWAQHVGFNLSFGICLFCVTELGRKLFDALLPFAGVHLHSADVHFIGRSRISLPAVVLDPFHFGVRAAGLFHLPHASVRSQFGFGAPLQLAVKSSVVSIQIRH